MKKSVKQYKPEFKVKVVLESLKGEKTTNQIAAKYDTVPRNIQYWRKQFLENAELAFDKEKSIKKYKQKLIRKEEELEEVYTELGKLTAQLNWAKKKFKEVGLRI